MLNLDQLIDGLFSLNNKKREDESKSSKLADDKRSSKSNEYFFEKLTPNKIDKLGIYENAIDFVFEDNKIRNIALTGSYGAGKSSVLETYKIKNEKEMIHISLTKFNLEPEKLPCDEEKQVNILERRILNQIIQQTDKNIISKTNFKMINNARLSEVGPPFIKIISFFVLFVFIIFFNNWKEIVISIHKTYVVNWLMVTTTPFFLLIVVLLCLLLFSVLLYSIFKIQKEKQLFKKLKINNNEVELSDEKEESYFDKYLDQFLYILTNIDVKTFVFEDIDRFCITQIFQRLHEINFLANNRSNYKSSEPIRFFYLIRDDLFSNKDRTKFFDFIIPIVPVLDSSNSYDQFIAHFDNLDRDFDRNFLEKVCMYIDDMRILKNIYNEYYIYSDKLQTNLHSENPGDHVLSPSKLLSIIIYKNLFPLDFSNLQFGSGYVYFALNNKLAIIQEIYKKTDEEIIDLSEKIRIIEEEALVSVDELDAIYLEISAKDFRFDGRSVEKDYDNRLDFISYLKKFSGELKYLNGTMVNITTLLGRLEEIPTYLDRRKIIESKSHESINKEKERICDLKRNKSYMKSCTLKDIVSPENFGLDLSELSDSNEDNFGEIKSNKYFPLIVYLLEEGYIDESYANYMTYFYENSITMNDKLFLMSIIERKELGYDYKIMNCKLLLEKLTERDFDKRESLNYQLINYMLCSKDKYKSKLQRLFQQLKDSKNYEYIANHFYYFSFYRASQADFVFYLNEQWNEFINNMLVDSDYEDYDIAEYIYITIVISTSDQLSTINKESCVTKYINKNYSNFYEVISGDVQKDIFLTSSDIEIEDREKYSYFLAEIFKELNVKFEKLEKIELHEEDLINDFDLFDIVHKDNLYEINLSNINYILKYTYRLIVSEEDFIVRNYELISRDKEKALFKYINSSDENINRYIELIVENIKSSSSGKLFKDNATIFLEILNNEKISLANKEGYLEKYSRALSDLSLVKTRSLWKILATNNKIALNQNNILEYFKENDLDSEIVTSINTTDTLCTFVEKNIIDTDISSRFKNSVVENKELTLGSYKKILEGFTTPYTTTLPFTFEKYEKIDSDKFVILIELNLIELNNISILYVRDKFPNHLVKFIKNNFDQYMSEVINADNLGYILNELIDLLESDIKDEYKIRLLEFLNNEKISITNKQYSEAVKSHIILNNYESEDTEILLKSYISQSEKIKDSFKKVVLLNYSEIFNKYDIPIELFADIINSEDVSIDTRIDVFSRYILNMNKDESRECFEKFELQDYISIFDGKNPRIDANDISERFLYAFKTHRWLSSYKFDEENNVYKVNNYKKNKKDIYTILEL